MTTIEESNGNSSNADELVVRGNAIEARRRKALLDFNIDPTDWPLYILRDEPAACEPDVSNKVHAQEAPPLSDEVWDAIADLFPKPHPNQRMSWRAVIDALLRLAATGVAWVRLGPENSAVRARLLRTREQFWDDIEKRINGAAIDAAERERIATLCTFARRYLSERDARANAAPTPTAVERLLNS